MAHPLPFILSIPHGGQRVPPEVANLCTLTEQEIFNESDAFTTEIYGMGEAVLAEVTQDIARAIVDLNRMKDEFPPLKVDGAIKAMTSLGDPVWRRNIIPDPGLINLLLERYYVPYHQRLEALLDKHRKEVRLLIDCHSMAPVGPPIAKDARLRRPLICLSNMGDEIGVPESAKKRTSLPSQTILKLSRIMGDVFSDDIALLSHANPILINNPFKGGYITQHYSSLGFWTMQIEISKNLYLHPKWFDPDERTVDGNRIQELKSKLRAALTELAAFIDKA